MNFLELAPETQAQFDGWLAGDDWIIACLCARWCDLCASYRATFGALAALHPDKRFVWIDIEDQCALVGDMDIDNFPTLLMQRGAQVAFFGPLEPQLQVVQAVLATQARKTPAELDAEAGADPVRQGWQRENHLRRR